MSRTLMALQRHHRCDAVLSFVHVTCDVLTVGLPACFHWSGFPRTSERSNSQWCTAGLASPAAQLKKKNKNSPWKKGRKKKRKKELFEARLHGFCQSASLSAMTSALSKGRTSESANRKRDDLCVKGRSQGHGQRLQRGPGGRIESGSH
mmetsp:Transcript_37613/g.63208  ORF Transcript_37613/g.63208 Transcript_37613/m.63208 type:complete len:149 (-) Transcript_37613:359-805(-)